MKKLLAAFLFVFLYAQTAFASVGGNWIFDFTIQGTYDSNPAVISESGGIIIKSAVSGDKEYLTGYDLGLIGQLTIPNWDYSYDFYYAADSTLPNQEFEMNKDFEISFDTSIDGAPVTYKIVLRQTAENSMTGTVSIITEDNTVNAGTVTASRPSITAGIFDRWDYSLSGTGYFNGYTASMNETGSIVISGTAGTDYDTVSSYSIYSKGSFSIPDMNNYYHEYEGSNDGSVSPPIEYFPGKPFSVFYNTNLDGTPATIYLYLLQNGDNSIKGKAKIVTANDVNFADITGTRYVEPAPSGDGGGGGGGCSTGLPFLVLLALPFIFRRKK